MHFARAPSFWTLTNVSDKFLSDTFAKKFGRGNFCALRRSSAREFQDRNLSHVSSWPFQLGQLVDGANVSGQLLDIDQKFIQSEISCSSQGQFGTCAVVRQEIALHANT